MSFSLDIKNFAEKTQQDAHKVKRSVAVTLADLIITRTPVDTGRLRGNWQASISAPAKGELDTTDQQSDKTLRAAITAFAPETDDSYFLANNLPYAQPIEYGWSKQKAPEGMVRVSIKEVQADLQRIIDEQTV